MLFVSPLTVSVRLPELPSIFWAFTSSIAVPLGFQSLRDILAGPAAHVAPSEDGPKP